MAQYLYRLGHFAVRRAWVVLIVWALVLGGVGVGALTLRKPFTSELTIPGTEFQNVIDDLQSSSPKAANGSGTVVFSTTEGGPFTPVQKQEIKDTLQDWSDIDGVDKATNPFKTQDDLDDSRSDVKDGKKDIADGKRTIEKNEKKLADSRDDIAEGRKALAKNAKNLVSGNEQLAAGQAELTKNQQEVDANRAKLAAGQEQLSQAREGIASGREQLSAGRAQLNKAQRELDESKDQLDKGRAARTTVDQAQQQLSAARAQIDALAAQKGEDDPEVVAAYAQLKEKQDALDAQAKLVPTAAELDAGEEALAAGQKKLNQSAATLDDKTTELEAGDKKLEASAKELASGQAQLEAVQAQLDAGQAGIDLNQIKLATGAGQIAQAQIDLDAAEDKIDDGEAKLAKAKKKLEDSEADLERGERRLDLMNGLRAVSKDGTVAVTSVTFDTPLSAVTAETKEALPHHAEGLAAVGVQVDYSSDVLPRAEVGGATEAIGIAVAAIVLFVMLGSMLAAGLPLLAAVVGVGTGLLGVLMVTHWVTMTDVTPVLALMLGLAVGIDYALFLVHRHRQQLMQGVEMRESIARATGTAGGAVLFAGLTVVIALAALTLTGIPFLGVMGLAGAATVAAAILVNLTLTPALLRFLGARALSRRQRRQLATTGAQPAVQAPRHSAPEPVKKALWGRVVTRHPLLTVLLTTVLLGVIAIPTLSLRLGLPDGSSEPHDSTAYQAYSRVSDAFGAGQNAAVLAVAKIDEDEARRLTKDDATDLQLDIAEDLKDTPDVEYVVPASISKDRRTMVFQIVPQSGPNDETTIELVHQLREDRSAIVDKTAVESIGFAGQTVANIDISQRLSDALPLYLSVVVGISLVLLLLVFRSLVVPLLATGGFLLSIAAAMGAVVAVFQWGWLGEAFGVEQPGLILSFLPTLAIGILFGLAMDYQMFLVSGMRESWTHGEPARLAVQSGFSHGAKVVTAAALIMTAVFSGFVFSGQMMVKPIGFVLALGVLIDAFLVRMTLMPALMHLLGERAWYLPRWMQRVLPDLDVEGTKLVAATTAPTDTAATVSPAPLPSAPRVGSTGGVSEGSDQSVHRAASGGAAAGTGSGSPWARPADATSPAAIATSGTEALPGDTGSDTGATPSAIADAQDSTRPEAAEVASGQGTIAGEGVADSPSAGATGTGESHQQAADRPSRDGTSSAPSIEPLVRPTRPTPHTQD